MISSYQCYPIRVPNLQAQQQQETLQRVKTSVHEIAHEEVIRIWHISTDSEKLHQVMELAVYVAAYCDWSIDLNDVAFFDKELPGFVAKFANLGFGDCSAGAEF